MHWNLTRLPSPSCISTDSFFKMVADAVVYHPTVAHYLRFVATTGGSWALSYLLRPSRLPMLTGSSPQLAVTSSSAPFNTSLASTHGTSSAPTTLLDSSRLTKRSRSNSASHGKRYAWVRMSSISKPRPSRLIARTWIQCSSTVP